MHGTCSLFPLLCTVQIDSYIVEIKIIKYQHSLIIAFPVHPHHSFFFAKWGTMPVSSWGRWLPSSFIFRLSSASWDRYFCNHIKNKASLPKLKIFNPGFFRLFQSSHNLPASQKGRKHTEALFWWKFKPWYMCVKWTMWIHGDTHKFSDLLRAASGTGDRTRCSPSVCVSRSHLFSLRTPYSHTLQDRS